jgi:hypothetical protein
MCDYSAKLIAWLDRELGDDKVAEVQRHIRECLECQTQLANYEWVTKAFDIVCDAAVESRRQPRWVSLLPAAAAVALVATLAWTMSRPTAETVDRAPLRSAPIARPDVTWSDAPATTPATRRPALRWQTTRHLHAHEANTLPPEPAIQVTIPAEDMFPPGAVPEGVNFTADVSLGPDGSAQQIRLRPRLIGFERRTN